MAAKIMAVNDDKVFLELLELLLTEEGYEVTLHSDRLTDVNLVKKIDPDLVIVDQLFNVDRVGWQLIQQMRLHKDTVNIPIILCTTEGRTVNELQEQLNKASVYVLLKPFNIDELYSVVQQSLFLENETLGKSDLRQLEASVKLN